MNVVRAVMRELYCIVRPELLQIVWRPSKPIDCRCRYKAVADPGEGGKGGHAPLPRLVKIGQKKMAAECVSLYFMFLAPPPLSEVSGSATDLKSDSL